MLLRSEDNAILARRRAYGQSRVICNVHWQSDVIEGRSVAAAVFARLQSEPEFKAAIASAKTELAAAQKKGLLPQRNCEAETKALSIYPKSASWPASK